MPQYIDNLTSVVNHDTEQIVLLNRAMLLASKHRMKDKG